MADRLAVGDEPAVRQLDNIGILRIIAGGEFRCETTGCVPARVVEGHVHVRSDEALLIEQDRALDVGQRLDAGDNLTSEVDGFRAAATNDVEGPTHRRHVEGVVTGGAHDRRLGRRGGQVEGVGCVGAGVGDKESGGGRRDDAVRLAP